MSNDHVTQTATEPVAHERDVRAELDVLMRADKRLSQAIVSRESGVSQAILSGWLNGKYAGDNARVERDLIRWMDAHRERMLSGAQLPEAPGYYVTGASTRALAAMAYAQAAGDMTVIYGGAGVGKSKSITHYAENYPSVFVAVMTPASESLMPALKDICAALGLQPGRTTQEMHRAICKRLSDTNGLLVIDEANHLGLQAVDQIRSIHDATGIGVALVGNERLYSNMTGGPRAPFLDRLFSRIGKRVHLPKNTLTDADAALTAWGVGSECRTMLTQVATKPGGGGLRVLTKLLRLANSYARADQRAMCCEDAKRALRELGGAE